MELVEIFNQIRDIPYRIPLTLEEEDNCCVGKHKKLFNLLKEKGYNVRYRICTFNWEDTNIPDHIKTIPHESKATHTYLEIEIDKEWKILDITWDKKLSNILPINNWDGRSDTNITVPKKTILSPEESIKIVKEEENKDFMINDLKLNKEFYKAINDWIESNRLTSNKAESQAL